MLNSDLVVASFFDKEAQRSTNFSGKEPKVGIVIVTLNRVRVLTSCIESLMKICYKNYEIIVVDNASTDNTAAVVGSLFPTVKLLVNEVNTGYTGGNNKGITYALGKGKCDYVLILNDDVEVDACFLTELVKVAEKNPKNGLACPMLLFFEDKKRLYTEYGDYNFYLGVSYQPLQNVRVPTEIGAVVGTCILVKQQLLHRIGPLDTNFFLYFDEADLCYRTRAAGFKIFYVPAARVYHKWSHSFSGWLNPVVFYYSARNELLFARKHLNFMVFLPLWIFRFSLRIMYYLFVKRNIQVAKFMLKGFFDFTQGKFGKASFKVNV
jgi:GT2 family glycosyltransferase